MNGAEFRSLALAAIAKGQPLVVEVLPEIDNFDQELVVDAGMRGRIVGISIADGFDEETPIFRFKVDLTEYMEYNKPYERAIWYFPGNSGKMGTASETGNWPKDNIDEIWLSSKDQACAAFAIIEGNNALHNDYLMDPVAMEDKETYVVWLERNLELERAKFIAIETIMKDMKQRVDRLPTVLPGESK